MTDNKYIFLTLFFNYFTALNHLKSFFNPEIFFYESVYRETAHRSIIKTG